ncbi:MAG TPA: NAD(P)H-dependent oxidoreductase subunit E [Candidatus Dormibacteraeota bacterium]
MSDRAQAGPDAITRKPAPIGLSAHALEEIRALPARYPHPRSAVMPALDVAQEEIGYLTPEAITQIAEALDLDAGYCEGVATFYSLFHLEPVGRHRFYVCTNLACMLRGAYDVLDHLNQAIGVKATGEVSKDALFSTEEVECLGACEYAPMLRLDHAYHYDLTPEKIDELVAERRSAATAGGEIAGAEPGVQKKSRQRRSTKGTPAHG